MSKRARIIGVISAALLLLGAAVWMILSGAVKAPQPPSGENASFVMGEERDVWRSV